MLVLDSTMAIDAAPDTDATFDDSVTVVLADDHLPDRMGFLRALEGEGFSVVAEVSDAGDAVGAVLRHRPDVCLLELGLRGGGITAIETISTKHPETRIAALAGTRAPRTRCTARYSQVPTATCLPTWRRTACRPR